MFWLLINSLTRIRAKIECSITRQSINRQKHKHRILEIQLTSLEIGVQVRPTSILTQTCGQFGYCVRKKTPKNVVFVRNSLQRTKKRKNCDAFSDFQNRCRQKLKKFCHRLNLSPRLVDPWVRNYVGWNRISQLERISIWFDK